MYPTWLDGWNLFPITFLNVSHHLFLQFSALFVNYPETLAQVSHAFAQVYSMMNLVFDSTQLPYFCFTGNWNTLLHCHGVFALHAFKTTPRTLCQTLRIISRSAGGSQSYCIFFFLNWWVSSEDLFTPRVVKPQRCQTNCNDVLICCLSCLFVVFFLKFLVFLMWSVASFSCFLLCVSSLSF